MLNENCACVLLPSFFFYAIRRVYNIMLQTKSEIYKPIAINTRPTAVQTGRERMME